MGSPIPTNDELEMGAPMEEPNDKPFDDTPFDAGVEADEEATPDKYIQQLAGKLGQSFRSYTQDNGEPNFDLEKFAINSVLSATNSGEMDQQDQSDIIAKVKSSTTNSGGEGEIDLSDGPSEEPSDGPSTDGMQEPDNDDIDLDDIDMEESHNPNFNGKTVFQNMTLDVKEGGMEENKYLNLENTDKSSIFVNKTVKEMIKETLRTEREPVTKTRTKPTDGRKRMTRESKAWRVSPNVTTAPKANEDTTQNSIQYVDFGKFVGVQGREQIEITFDVDDVRFVEVFKNTGEVLSSPTKGHHDEPWIYSYETDILSNGKQYGVHVEYFGDPRTHLDLVGFYDNVPEIEEV